MKFPSIVALSLIYILHITFAEEISEAKTENVSMTRQTLSSVIT